MAPFKVLFVACVRPAHLLSTFHPHVPQKLHVAASNGYMNSLKMLLENRAKPSLPDDTEQNTPLHLAIFFQNYKAVELLCEHGADVNARNKFNQPPVNLSEDPTMLRIMKSIEAKEKPNNALRVEGQGRSDRYLESSVEHREMGVSEACFLFLMLVRLFCFFASYLHPSPSLRSLPPARSSGNR